MYDETWIRQQAEKSLHRISPRLAGRLSGPIESEPEEWDAFTKRLEVNFPQLFKHYFTLYSQRYDFFYSLEELLYCIANAWFKRPKELKNLDNLREREPLWFQSNQMIGGVCYVDLFSGNLSNLKLKIPYIKELGLTYLHLMPIFLAPEGDNDGGYAVSSYREVQTALGTMEQLTELANDLRKDGISLVLDFVINHTSDEHTWANNAKSGDPDYVEYYRIYPNREMPDEYEKNLREIFPDEHPGAFTYRPELDGWVWTTFHGYQWDLNYENPVVFNSMVEELLFLANAGVEVLRLDAVAFIWKQLGTDCENLPFAHNIIQGFNSVTKIAAPSLLLKSEAIVHPDEVIKYIDPNECQLSYNPLLMALLWNSLATREVKLLKQSLLERYQINPQCTWVNYVRCHDDIGWTFSDEDAARIGINGYDHRQFLNNFYTGRFPGSFARGLPFQENLRTGDARISGTCASLAGLEKAIQENAEDEITLAINRILLLHAVILTIGGIPLIYLGDELGSLNDYNFRNDPDKAHDSRWVHRFPTDWEKAERRKDNNSLESRIFAGILNLIQLRKDNPVFSNGMMGLADVENNHVLGYLRHQDASRLLVLANFSEQEQEISLNTVRLFLLDYSFEDLYSGEKIAAENIELGPYQIRFLSTRTENYTEDRLL